jgi:hypothetical protein
MLRISPRWIRLPIISLTERSLRLRTKRRGGMQNRVWQAPLPQAMRLACRTVDYLITDPAEEPQRKARLTWCTTKDGWKIG